MDNKDREILLDEKLISAIAEKVIERIETYKKNILVIYQDCEEGFMEGLDSLNKLKKEGYVYTVLLSQKAAKKLPVDDIKKYLEPKEVLVETSISSVRGFLDKFNMVIVPSLTINTVAGLTNGLCDSKVAEIILECMMEGKKILMAIDGCCPINLQKHHSRYKMKKSLENRLLANMEDLRNYGAKLSFGKNIHFNAKKLMGTNHDGERENKKIDYEFRGKVLSGGFVRTLPINSSLRIPKETLITHMAKDEVGKLGIKITKY